MSIATVTSSKIFLAPGQLDTPSGNGLVALGNSLPAGWGPKPVDIDGRAFATPFGRAEAMRRILDSLVGEPNSSQHPWVIAEYFDTLLLGIVTGVVAVEVVSLSDRRLDNFGRALTDAEPDIEILPVLRHEKSKLILGFGHPDALVWPNARLAPFDNTLDNTTAAKWKELKAAIDPRREEAVRLLSEFRESLIGAKHWDPANMLPWQRGIDKLVGDVSNSGKSLLHRQARSAGPFQLRLNGDEPNNAHFVYLPVYVPLEDSVAFCDRIVKSANARPRADQKDGTLDLEDTRDLEDTLREPTMTFRQGHWHVGAGTLVNTETLSAPTDAGSAQAQTNWLLLDGDKGFAKHFDTLLNDLDAEYHWKSNRELVRKQPYLFPDLVRAYVNVGGDPKLRRTRQCHKLALQKLSRLIDLKDVKDVRSNQYYVTEVGTFGTGATTPVLYVDHAKGLDVMDLCALGSALFTAFIVGPEAVVAPTLRDEDGISLLQDTPEFRESPLEAAPGCYNIVCRSPGPEHKRLGSLQRLVGSYKRLAHECKGSQDASLAELLSRAAQSYARWAYGAEVKPMGAPGHPIELRIDSFTLKVFVDSVRWPVLGSAT